jgi:hypothetical protein
MRKIIRALKRPREPKRAVESAYEHLHKLTHQIFESICQLKEIVMATREEVIATLQRAATKQEKTIAEIGTLQGTVTELKAEIVTLKDLIAQGGEITQDLVDAANRVEILAGQADEQIPDVEPVPTE